MSNKINVESKKTKKKGKTETKKVDPEMELEGNLKLNQVRKKQFKKEKKMRNRRDKVAQQLASGLENFTLKSDNKNYNFDTDYTQDN